MAGQRAWNPETLLEKSGSFWMSSTLHAGVKMDLFSAIGDTPISGEDLAGRLGLDPRALIVLLNALSGLGLLTKDGEVFSSTQASRDYLCQDSPNYIGYMIMHHESLVESFNKIPQAVKTGRPVRQKSAFRDEETRKNFLLGMFNGALGTAPKVAEILDLKDRKHLLDLGGGPGTYAIFFCKAYPHLQATVYDLPMAESFMSDTVRKFGMEDRITFIPGNYLEEEVPGKYDAFWLSHILHAEGPEACQSILEKCVKAANPGAMVWIHEFILNNTMDSPTFPTLFSINMLLGTEAGQSYSEEQLTGMMEKAGMVDIKRVDFTGRAQSGILQGRVG